MGTECHHHLLHVELQDLQGEFDELVGGVVRLQRSHRGVVDITRSGHDSIGQRNGQSVRLSQAGCGRVERVFDGGAVVFVLPNDRPADRESSVAIVMLGRS
jgi:hypothetical protein